MQVADTGCGIDAADLPRIFDRFYRGEKSRSDSTGNAGLGLAITKRILELHGSSISVVSQAGLTIIGFTLGYANAERAAAPVPAENTSASATRLSLAAPGQAPSASA